MNQEPFAFVHGEKEKLDEGRAIDQMMRRDEGNNG